MSDDPTLSRRALLRGAVSLPVVSGLVGCGASIPGQAVTYGAAAEVPQGTPTQVEGYNVFVLRTDAGIGAIGGRCPHRGCGVNLRSEGDGYGCRCHGSRFENDGSYISGPANAPLPWYRVRIEDGQVVVDPTEEVPMGTFTPVG
jgi:Rieske Fe-S protein